MSGVLGTAQWSKDPGHWRYAPLGEGGSALQGGYLLLGGSKDIPGYLHVRAPSKHMLTIAPTRSGKGVSLIIPNLLTYRGSVLVVDPKGENAWVTAERRRALDKNRNTFILDPWGEVNRRYGSMAGAPEKIARFNPLAQLDPETDEFVDDIAGLADAIILTESSREPHWDDSARELVAGLMAFMVESPQYRPHASLALMRDFVTRPIEQIRAMVEESQKLGGRSLAARKLAPFKADTDEISGITSNARTQTAFLDSPTLKRNMEVSDFSFEDLCRGNTSVYLVLPPDKLETYARWLRLMVTVGIRAVGRGGSQGPLPTLFMLDEFGTIGKLDAVAHAYGLMAGLGMILWAFAQDLNQLVRDYPHHWETFVGNAQAVTCFGVMDNFTADYVSKFLGTTTIEQPNIQTSTGTSVAPRQPNQDFLTSRTTRSTSISTSTSTMSRPLLHPDEVRALGADACIIMGRFPPIRARRIVYHQDWDFLHWARADPHFPRNETVRRQALYNRLIEMESVARLLQEPEYGYEVKRRRGKWEVTGMPGSGKGTHIFASDDALWRWAYVLVMDGVDQA
jgi:type IV secretion system protein VirD4